MIVLDDDKCTWPCWVEWRWSWLKMCWTIAMCRICEEMPEEDRGQV